MSFLKFQADSIFTGTQMLGSHHVLITNENGVIEDIVEEQEAGVDIQKLNGTISPGFINCHCHLELSHLKDIIPEQSGLVDFILAILSKRESTKEIIQDAIESAEKEMIKNGIVAVGDICNTTDTLFQKQKNNLYYHNFIEVSGFVPSTANERFELGKEIYHSFSSIFPNNTSLVPHAPYSVSDNLFELIKSFSKNNILSIHNQETLDENSFFKNKTGDFLRLFKSLGIDIGFFTATKKTSLASTINHLSQSLKTILVHNAYTNESDLQIIKYFSQSNKTQFYLCLCVLANRYISKSVPSGILFQKDFFKIVLGTDSLASNKSLNIFEEMKELKNCYPQLSNFELLQFATINGAAALGVEDNFGSLMKGKKPGVLLIEDFKTSIQPKKLV